MSDKPLKYVTGEPWWRTLGLADYRGQSWRGRLEHIVAETARALSARGLDPDLTSVRGDEQHQLVPYQQPLLRECHEAYLVAKACLRNPGASLRGHRLAQLWDGQGLASVAGPALVAQSRRVSQLKRNTKAAAKKRREIGEKTRKRVADTGRVGRLSERHIRRLIKKK